MMLLYSKFTKKYWQAENPFWGTTTCCILEPSNKWIENYRSFRHVVLSYASKTAHNPICLANLKYKFNIRSFKY